MSGRSMKRRIEALEKAGLHSARKTPERVVELISADVAKSGQRGTARATGLTLKAVQSYLRGIGMPTTTTLQLLADYFDETFVIEIRPQTRRAQDDPPHSTNSEEPGAASAEIYRLLDTIYVPVRGRIKWLSEKTGYSRTQVGDILGGRRTFTDRFKRLALDAITKERDLQKSAINVGPGKPHGFTAPELYLTIKQAAQRYPAFTESSIRWLIFNEHRNGFDQVVRRVGRKILIHDQSFQAWIEKGNQS